MADGSSNLYYGQAQGGAIQTGYALQTGASMVILTISNSIVEENEAVAGSDGSTLTYPRTDSAVGGGIGNLLGGTVNVIGCTITGNQALGGATASGSGGIAYGGGIANVEGTLNLTNSTVTTNLSQGGAGASGAAGGIAAGGINNSRVNAIAIVTNCTISFNEYLGGAGGAGANGGDALGGGIENAFYAFAFGATDTSSLVVSNCQIVGNTAQGGTEGSSGVGVNGLGGGVYVGSGTAVLGATLVSGNQAQGGVDSNGNTTGQGLGGGVYVDPSASATEDMATFIAGNQATKSNNDVWGTLTIGP